MKAKYQVAQPNQTVTFLSVYRFRAIAHNLQRGNMLETKDHAVAEFARVASEMLNGQEIIFTAEEELPF